MNPTLRSAVTLLALLVLSHLPGAAQAAPTFSVPGFVDETLYQGNGMISMRFDPVGRLWVAEKQGRVLVFEPNPNGPSSFNYDYYQAAAGTQFTTFPDFATATPVKSGVVTSFTLDPRQQNDDFAFRFTGSINIPTSGVYTFYLISDDGSRLFIDNVATPVVNQPTAGNKSGTVNLTAGAHTIRVEYYERGGGESLRVEYEGPGLPRGPVAQGAFKTPQVFANFASQVNTQGERGMTGLTLDPDFANTRYVYVLFATNTDQRILRLTANAAFNAMVAGSETILLSGLPNTNTVHKAGDIAFHPNDPNNLYVMIGDDGERQIVGNLDLYNGKLLKISASDGKGLPTNPHYNGNVDSVRSRVWSARYRNPYRFTFDPAAPINDVLYISENGDGTDRLAQITKGADGGWDNAFTTTAAGRKIMHTSDPSKTGVAIFRSGPFAPDGNPVIYNARYGGGTRNEVRRWTLTGANLDVLTPLPADNGAAFYAAFEDHGIVSFTAGPDGALYYTDSGQGPSLGTTQRLGRIRFVGGAAPVANFSASPQTGQSPRAVTFTDASTAPGSTVSGWSWNFGDGTGSAQQNPVHTYTQPGVYTVTLVVTNALGLNHSKQAVVTIYHETNLALTGQIVDGRSLPAPNFAAPTEVRLYQADGVTPLPFTGGTGAAGNAAPVPAGGTINLAVNNARITGPGVVISAGEPAADGVQAAYVGSPLSTTLASQSASVTFRLSDTMLRGRVRDTKGNVAGVDLGLARSAAGAYHAFAGGRDFLSGSGYPASGVLHRTVPDALGYYHVPIRTGSGGAFFYLDTAADTLAATHGRTTRVTPVPAGEATVQNLTIGLYDGGTGETDLSGITVTPAVNFDTQIQPLLSNLCAACHNAIATNSFGLNLESGSAFNELVGQESLEAPGVKLVEPGSPARSYLMEKINAALPQVGTSMRPGDPMPVAQRALFRDWIAQLVTASQFQFIGAAFASQEGASATTATITVRRLGATTAAVGVTAATTGGGSAAAGADYTTTSVTLSWAAGDGADKTFTIPILSDGLAESSETVSLQLTLPTGGATLATTNVTATLTILDRPFDRWRNEFFGAAANSPEAQPTADFDQDGFSNFQEYCLNTDPTKPQSASSPRVGTDAGGRLQLSFTRNPTATGITFRVEAINSLGTSPWQTIASKAGTAAWITEPGVSVTDDSATGAVVVRDSGLISDLAKRFLRLQMERTTD